MNELTSGLLVFVLSYLCGSLPSGYLIGKFNGVDIRQYGSHNIGATNVRRVLGRDWSFICFAMDFLKGLLPVVFIGHSLGGRLAIGASWGGIIAAIAAVLGHIFPIWLKFKGGKGVATSLGVVSGIAFIPVLIGGIAWLVVFHFSRMVSLASMVAVTVIALVALGMQFASGAIGWPGVILLAIIAALVIIRHKDNIKRIRNGTEGKFEKKSNENKGEAKESK
ncbi:MAG: glycerol-3-phosphate 1-O-acyltransferase PlsY [Victivallales bacterium]|nr:glycerol-3-phosphate 1-O-acyltransferase PlsY [Victivallales bacterium]